jgi:hypothetical protein
MKSTMLFILVNLWTHNLLADWVCNAYCDHGGYILITEHADHPVEALNQIIRKCAEAKYSDETLLIKVYSGPSTNYEQASVENSCKFVDITKY